MFYHLRSVREPNSSPQIRVLGLNRKMDLVCILIEGPSGKVVAGLQGWVAVPGELPFAAAEVQGCSGVVSDTLFNLE